MLSSTKVHASFLREARDLPGKMTIINSEYFPAASGIVNDSTQGWQMLPRETFDVPETLVRETRPMEVLA